MTVELPDWLEENFVDVEKLFIDMFEVLFPGFICGCWTPDDWLEDDRINPDPLLQFYRLPGGAVDWDKRTDECQLQVLIYTGSRDDSWRVMNSIRAILLPIQGDKIRMSDGYVAQVNSVGEARGGGPQLLSPGQLADERVVAATFQVKVKMKSTTNYKQQLYGLLS